MKQTKNYYTSEKLQQIFDSKPKATQLKLLYKSIDCMERGGNAVSGFECLARAMGFEPASDGSLGWERTRN
jgi:hypothetical protein